MKYKVNVFGCLFHINIYKNNFIGFLIEPYNIFEKLKGYNYTDFPCRIEDLYICQPGIWKSNLLWYFNFSSVMIEEL